MTVEREKEGRAEFTLFARWECKYRTYGSIYFLGKLYYSLVPLPHARSKEKLSLWLHSITGRKCTHDAHLYIK